MAIVGVVMILLGVVAIWLGFDQVAYPNARVSGAIFFAAGWLLISLDRIAWTLEKTRRILRQDRQDKQGKQGKPFDSDGSGTQDNSS